MKGTVKFFNNRRSWGFITGDDGKDYFVHYTGIVGDGFRTLKNDSPVLFDLKETPDHGMQAVNVKSVTTTKPVKRKKKKK